MNLFRSEEHIRNWAQFDPESEDGIVPLDGLMKVFSGNYFRKRLDPDWVSRSREYAFEMVATMQQIGKTGPFWQPTRP